MLRTKVMINLLESAQLISILNTAKEKLAYVAVKYSWLAVSSP